MKALEVIGWEKALRFLFFTVYRLLLHGAIVPQLRSFLLVAAGAKIGGGSVILDVDFSNLHHYGFRRMKIGKRCFIGDGALLDTRGGLDFGDDVTLSSRVVLITHTNVGFPNHPLQKVYPPKEGKITIGNGAYLGTAAIVLPGITIGKEAVVGAGAVVTHNVAPRMVVAGVPARVIKKVSKHQRVKVSKKLPLTP
ncbi:acyltransferase [Candidatus Gottesmanbacteria bacterium]|nr:acyltransferase [Candidatus Gottesmanbacteria bacterium]